MCLHSENRGAPSDALSQQGNYTTGHVSNTRRIPGLSTWDSWWSQQDSNLWSRCARSTSQWSPRRAAACDAPLLSTPPPRFFPHCGRSAPAPHRCFTSPESRYLIPISSTKAKPPALGWFCFGGRNRTRTCDPIDVNDVLYQLSHATIYVIRFLGLAVHVTSMNTHRIGWATRQRASFKNAKLL